MSRTFRTLRRARPGLSLVELLLFCGLLAISAGAVVGFFMLSTESRIRQTIASDVEQNIINLHQLLEHEVRHAERIVDPPRLQSGSILTLQLGYSDGNPTILTVQSGAMLLVRKDTEYVVSPQEVTVSNFRVFNTSPRDDRPSLFYTFTVSRLVPVPPHPVPYTRKHTAGVVVFPDHQIVGSSCGCAPPRCDHARYEWDTCTLGVCTAESGSILCQK